MQPVPLSIPHIFHRAEQQFGDKQITSSLGGEIRHISIANWACRVRSLASALDTLDVPSAATVATFGYNSQAHLELYYAVPCTGRVLHTLNIRLSLEHLRFMIVQAEDDVVFIDRGLFSQLWPLADELPQLRLWIVMDDGSNAALPIDHRIVEYEALLADSASFAGEFVIDDENRAAGICYTSGTSGNPKGVVYSHRSTVLHALASMAAGLIGLSERDVVLPIVPMFHASAWGLPYSALFAGSNIVLPGSSMEPRALLSLMSEEHVTVASAVPTIWASLLRHVRDFDLSALRATFGGGSATPARLAKEWMTAVGVPITHTWGMTELSPTGVIGGLRSVDDFATEAERQHTLMAQGTAVPLVELRILDLDTMARQPHDGVAVGELQAHGPTVASGYLGEGSPEAAFTADGWLRTGDIASIDPRGYVVIRDRIKDLIKSGGEWIPSQELETAIMRNPEVSEVAVVARPDPRWAERPVAFVVGVDGSQLDQEGVLERLRPHVPKWWLPDQVFIVDALPRTGTGKIAKQTLREGL